MPCALSFASSIPHHTPNLSSEKKYLQARGYQPIRRFVDKSYDPIVRLWHIPFISPLRINGSFLKIIHLILEIIGVKVKTDAEAKR